MKRQTLVARYLLAALGAVLAAPPATAITLVSPAQFKDVEGNRSFPGTPYPDGGDSTAPNGFRVQELHFASDLSSLGPGPLVITALAYRPDVSVNQPLSKAWDITAVNLSTTTRTALSSSFEGNYGAGGVTTVLSGVVQLETDGVPPPGALPHDFDYTFNFQTPHVYDPQRGNLLVEFIFPNDFEAIWQDATNEAGVDRFAFAFADDAQFADIANAVGDP